MRSRQSTSGIVQLVTRRVRAGGRADSQFFTAWETLEQCGWRADEVSQALQIARSKYWGYRPFAQEFHVAENLDLAKSIARANPQHGRGGGVKLFIPFAQHAKALVPVGDLIPLFECRERTKPSPTGFIETVLELELSLGNALVDADNDGDSSAPTRFWLQEPLHESKIACLEIPSSVSVFQDPDIHGDTLGFESRDDGQVLIAPVPETPPKRSWLNNILGR